MNQATLRMGAQGPKRFLLLLTAVVLTSCSSGSAAHDRRAGHVSAVSFDQNGLFQMVLDGVRFEIDSQSEMNFAFHSNTQTTTEDGELTSQRSETSETLTLQGQPLRIDRGTLEIGNQKFGQVTSGDVVHLEAGIVSVNGKFRGTLSRK